MRFTDRRHRMRQVVVGTYTEVEDGREVTRPIKVFVGRKALEVKS